MAGNSISPAFRNADRRANDLLAGLGAFASSAPLGGGYATSSPTSQIVNGAAIYLYAGEVVTNIHVCVQTAGSGTAPTAAACGLWNSAANPVCLAITADLVGGATLTSQGWKTYALSAAYTVTAAGIYYPSFWINGAYASTNVSFIVHGANGQAGGALGSGSRSFGALKSSVSTAPAVNDTGTYAIQAGVPVFAVS